MTPNARVAAAIDVLESILAGHPGEKTLTTWARKNRYAGSKDRAALRDLVFDALRQLRSSAHVGGSLSGRGVMIGQLRLQNIDPASVFTGQGYAPSALSDEELAQGATLEQAPDAIRLDCQDWLLLLFRASLKEQTDAVLSRLRTRAPVFVRVNGAQGTLAEAMDALAAEDIASQAHPLSPLALEITQNPRRLRQSTAFLSGLVELQDVASQAVVDIFCNAVPQGDVLDFCAGGGGKSLALAAQSLRVVAHDIDAKRMGDIPERAARAGVEIPLIADPIGPYDAVLCDAPCSGSGAWRRQPDAKWRLTPEALEALNETQDAILDQACGLVKTGGVLGYATCSLLKDENDARTDAFLGRHPDWTLLLRHQFTPLDGGDGFFIALLARA